MTEQSTRGRPSPPPPVPNSPVDLRLLGNESHLGSTCTVYAGAWEEGEGEDEQSLTLPVQKYLHPVDGQTDRHTERNQPQ